MLNPRDVLAHAQALQTQIVAWRRDIHRHPELGFEEVRTANLVANTLREFGYEVQTGIGRTGVVAAIGQGERTIALRADMDALPIHELNTSDFVSQVPGKMHACGHDAHTAMLLGAAKIFAEHQHELPGEIRLFFQPCEETNDVEGKSGGQRMVEEGVMDGVERVIALHVASDLPAGKIVVGDGYITAAADTFYATLKGVGVHAAHPDRGVDPIFILAQVINAIHGVRARRIDPTKAALISIGSVHGGTAENVIPDEVTLTGTIRSYEDEIRQQLWRELEQALALARAFGGDYELTLIKGCPSVYNDPHVVASLRTLVTDQFGSEALLFNDPSMGGEDFSFMTRAAPGAMFLLGAKYDDRSRPHHSPIFEIDESVFHIGTAMLVNGALALMQQR
jgi:amidohydrolase